jgi:hypothetical protein
LHGVDHKIEVISRYLKKVEWVELGYISQTVLQLSKATEDTSPVGLALTVLDTDAELNGKPIDSC